MALSGNCGHGALARLAGGDLRSFVIVIVLGLSAYFVMSGPLAHLRVMLFPVEFDLEPSQGFALLAKNLFGIGPSATGVAVGGLFLLIALASP